ncbi:MAG: phenylalanine--tRNA ligase subunit beta [Bacteroidetes bacterium]|nr:phenylalanine--tRNA ligase subunit beta [Bacteroidota bacterium]
MTIAYSWLAQYIDLIETPDETGKILTSTGLEVEGIHDFETVRGSLKGLVIGEVLSCSKHPNADKLSLTTVDVGESRVYPIVCGAPNVAAGQRVIVALPGTTLYPFSGDPFTIKIAKIRGEVSEGMICAEDEIGLGKSHAGIIVLDRAKVAHLPNGTPAFSYFQVASDSVFEIGLTPNRADAASHIGVARDLHAATGRPLRWPSVDAFKVDNHDLVIPVEVENAEACPRYSAVTIKGVTIGESPAWLKNRLQSIGLNPINNIVDITNFVCHEVGQPLHAFDAAAIDGNKVIVKTLSKGSKFVTLDGKERALATEDLMICNTQEGMCIAGVFGGLRSGITELTKDVFLESACFSPDYIRRTGMQHQLKTDASFRFSRGTDPNITVYALKRAALLIKELAGGKISSDIVDVYPSPVTNRLITVKDRNVNRLIGKTIPREEVFDILRRLDIEVTEKHDTHYVVSVPPYRVDVLQEADVVEEILRIYGFNRIQLEERTGTDFLAAFPDQDIDVFKRSIAEMLVANGFYEIFTNSLTNQAYQKGKELGLEGEPVEILNKLSEEQGILRQTMLFTGLEACAYNFNRKQRSIRFFEFGKTYHLVGEKYLEKEHLALYMGGMAEAESWQVKAREVNYHDLAQQVAHLAEKCAISITQTSKLNDPLFDYGTQFMSGGNELGKAGKVRTSLAAGFGLKQEIFYADLNAPLLFQSANPKFDVKDVPKFPEVKRDLSLVLDKRVEFEEIKKLVAETEKMLVKEVTAFDVYQGENIPAGKKAYALGFTLQDETKTLTDEEIDKTMNKLMTAFESRLGAVIRK